MEGVYIFNHETHERDEILFVRFARFVVEALLAPATRMGSWSVSPITVIPAAFVTTAPVIPVIMPVSIAIIVSGHYVSPIGRIVVAVVGVNVVIRVAIRRRVCRIIVAVGHYRPNSDSNPDRDMGAGLGCYH